jgi:nicotinamide mononucleotide transporter
MEFFLDQISQIWWPGFLQWVRVSYIELIATVTGLIYLFYSIKGDRRLWVYGLITSALYVYICFIAGIYADMGINFYYVGVSIYGWVHWTLYREEKKKIIPVTQTTLKQWFLVLGATLVFYIIIVNILIHFTDSTIPYWDAFTTSASITATWMLARKMLEHWIIWIVIDAISIGLYIYKGLYPSSILFLVYTIMAAVGFIQWKKQWVQDQKS